MVGREAELDYRLEFLTVLMTDFDETGWISSGLRRSELLKEIPS